MKHLLGTKTAIYCPTLNLALELEKLLNSKGLIKSLSNIRDYFSDYEDCFCISIWNFPDRLEYSSSTYYAKAGYTIVNAEDFIKNFNMENEELKITKEKVLEAANKCSVAKETLKILFPKVFEEELWFRIGDTFEWNSDIYILAWIDDDIISLINIKEGTRLFNPIKPKILTYSKVSSEEIIKELLEDKGLTIKKSSKKAKYLIS